MTSPESDIYDAVREQLRAQPRTWLITGVAGFIGSHLGEHLLALGQRVVGLDNFDTGKQENLDALVRGADERAATAGWAHAGTAGARFEFRRADVRDLAACVAACAGVDHVLHQAAVASVPRTLAEPEVAHAVNVDGAFHLLEAARRAGSVRSLVHASSSAVYGDYPGAPESGAQIEEHISRPLSPYAGQKRMAEILGQTWTRTHGLATAGLRYFNIVGPRQDPNGAYAAVIPKWVDTFARGEQPLIFGDGETSRDFCPVEDVVQANLLAATWPERVDAAGRERPGDPSEGVFNVGLGGRTSLLELFAMIREGMAGLGVDCGGVEPEFREFRAGDIRHSRADIERARTQLGYRPRMNMQESLLATMRWLLAMNG
ncbi:MAG: NAD-dependent epimerase/dehydratase family protein [Myxococcales bacterium]|nr:NAD-dependent epimerase/dehydratase family protein [Myxococcales bacterium]